MWARTLLSAKARLLQHEKPQPPSWGFPVARAREDTAKSETLSRTRTNGPLLVLALSLAGDSSRAQKVIAELSQRYPSDTLPQSVYLPMAKAILESSPSGSARSIETLQPTARFEFGPDSSFLPIYVRDLVYLRARQGHEAEGEFRKIPDHRGVSPLAPEYVLARLGLARAYSLQGDQAKARTAYQDFLALWKDADPDVPVLKEAKAEYGKLPSPAFIGMWWHAQCFRRTLLECPEFKVVWSRACTDGC
jgi:hypothetical protein